MMLTFTVDPSLFPDPRAAYEYMADQRCISRTMQDLRRGGWLHTKRYFYVVEWQKNTEQAHFHVLVDSSFIPHSALLASWGKHRPKSAGPIVGDRPAFGTVIYTRSLFAGGAEHAARYATKYLIKYPACGFPAWVMASGDERRIRRYSTSRGFWGIVAQQRGEPETSREITPRTYAQRVAGCGEFVNMFHVCEVDPSTEGTVKMRRFLGVLAVPSSVLQPADHYLHCPRVKANSVHSLLRIVSDFAGYRVRQVGKVHRPEVAI